VAGIVTLLIVFPGKSSRCLITGVGMVHCTSQASWLSYGHVVTTAEPYAAASWCGPV